MANKFSQNPIMIDTPWTAGTIPAALTALTTPQEFRRIEWFKPLATTDQCIVTDINGNVIIEAQCETANVSQYLWTDGRAPIKFKMGQWVVSTLGSGTLLLYK